MEEISFFVFLGLKSIYYNISFLNLCRLYERKQISLQRKNNSQLNMYRGRFLIFAKVISGQT